MLIKNLTHTYRINPDFVFVGDGHLLEDALTHVSLPLTAQALPPAVTTVRQARRGEKTTVTTCTTRLNRWVSNAV